MTNFAACMKNWTLLHTMRSFSGCWIVLIGILLVMCRQSNQPEGVLPPDEMARIMVELYLAEARLTDQMMEKDSARKYFFPFEQKLLEKYGLPDSVILKSYQYYVDHPAEFESIYDSVIDTLSLREQKARALPVEVK